MSFYSGVSTADLAARALELARIWRDEQRMGLTGLAHVLANAGPEALARLGEAARPGLVFVLLMNDRPRGEGELDLGSQWGGWPVWTVAHLVRDVFIPGANNRDVPSSTRAWCLLVALAASPGHPTIPTMLMHARVSDLADLLPGTGLRLLGALREIREHARLERSDASRSRLEVDLVECLELVEALGAAPSSVPEASRREDGAGKKPRASRITVVDNEVYLSIRELEELFSMSRRTLERRLGGDADVPRCKGPRNTIHYAAGATLRWAVSQTPPVLFDLSKLDDERRMQVITSIESSPGRAPISTARAHDAELRPAQRKKRGGA